MEFEQIAMIADKDFSIQKTITEKGWLWTRDIVTAKGILTAPEFVMPEVIENVAELRYNYEMFPGKEFELIHYRSGSNFVGARISGGVSHFGLHVLKIDDFRDYFDKKGFYLVQEVVTIHHTNVRDDRHYHYAIYRHNASGVAWKLIRRLEDNVAWEFAKADMNKRYKHDIF